MTLRTYLWTVLATYALAVVIYRSGHPWLALAVPLAVKTLAGLLLCAPMFKPRPRTTLGWRELQQAWREFRRERGR